MAAPSTTPDVKTPPGRAPFLNQIQNDFMRKADMWNRERVLQMRKLKAKNILTGLLLGGTVASIYAYSIMAIKQETFLDDLDEPERAET
ncbi:hypothetical protein RvY_18449 [Ramazzottius varieornatus]|uniref:Cytochrome c oxidase assembly factor 3 n=1 Tax=Ramazzottius varieornatus TaxID=947166 RepID=A0A1D1W926_RAMVA|nr:hypothetical protein RvY_18449 [Ramazzottius varieornatus]